MQRQHAPGYGSSRTFRQKLGIYLLGVAIGLVMFGWFQMRKRQAAAYQQQQQQATEAGSATPETAESPSPPEPNPSDG